MSDVAVAAPATPVAESTTPKRTRAPRAAAAPKPVVAKPKVVKQPKSPKETKVPKVKTPSTHPPYITMITEAIREVKDRKGTTKQAILKYISEHYDVGSNPVQVNSHLRLALKRGVVTKALVQASGNGAAGRFKIGDNKKAPSSAVNTPVKPAAAKKSEGSEKKKASSKKSASDNKVKKVKSPKKISKPAAKKAAKSPKKVVTPKKPVTTITKSGRKAIVAKV